MAIIKYTGIIDSRDNLNDCNGGENSYPGAWKLQGGFGASQEVVSLVSLLECLHE